MAKVIVVLLLALAGAGGFWWYKGGFGHGGQADVRFRTAKVDRGEVVEGVQASGAVQPLLLVQVGTQISGAIDKLFVDFNSKVTKGQIVALLDMRRLQAQVKQDEALVARSKADLERMRAVVVQARTDVDKARAMLATSHADVQRVQALLTQAEKDMERQKQLGEKRLVSPSDVDAAVASKESLDAQLVAANATVQQNEAQVASVEATVGQDEAQLAVGAATIQQNEAQLTSDNVNLDFATIVSPVDGVVVSRNVDVGQTVAASLSAPTLFVIANDLTKIQVQASVPEADVGKIHEKQPARFGVDAHPDRVFEGVVSQVRLASTTVQNVVTYTVMVDANNPDGLLLPGMTANVTFEISRSAKDAMRVPASALRLQPPADLLDAPPPQRESPREPNQEGEKPAGGAPEGPRPPRGGRDGAGGWRGGGGGGDAASGSRPQRTGSRRGRAYVYVQTPDNRLHALPVKVGISDGITTVVEPLDGATLEEGMEVVTAILKDSEPATTNPFAPPRMGGGRGR
jgi:HlyD family secretion protein